MSHKTQKRQAFESKRESKWTLMIAPIYNDNLNAFFALYETIIEKYFVVMCIPLFLLQNRDLLNDLIT